MGVLLRADLTGLEPIQPISWFLPKGKSKHDRGNKKKDRIIKGVLNGKSQKNCDCQQLIAYLLLHDYTLSWCINTLGAIQRLRGPNFTQFWCPHPPWSGQKWTFYILSTRGLSTDPHVVIEQPPIAHAVQTLTLMKNLVNLHMYKKEYSFGKDFIPL